MGSQRGEKWNGAGQGTCYKREEAEKRFPFLPAHPEMESLPTEVKLAPSLDSFQNRLDEIIVGKNTNSCFEETKAKEYTFYRNLIIS